MNKAESWTRVHIPCQVLHSVFTNISVYTNCQARKLFSHHGCFEFTGVAEGGIMFTRIRGGTMTEWASDDGRIRLIHGDCRKKIHTIAWPISADALITDPPYGIGMDGRKQDTSKHGGHKGYKFKKWDSAPPDARTFQYLREFPVCVIWGANYFSRHLPAKSGWLVWDKGQRIDNSDGELAWTNQDRALRILTLNRVALMQDGAIHPTQKPVALMEWCMDVVKVPKNALVYDPYMGSGSTGVACIRTGRRFLGYEADEEYFEGAKQRIIRELAQPFMPGLEPSRQVQPSLI